MDFEQFRRTVLRNAASGSTWVYRGQRKCSWPLVTSYSRFCLQFSAEASNFSLDSFRSMLTRFIRRASEASGKDYGTFSPLQQMALAQHHGVPTPILDWSHSPYVAAYFAVTGSPGAAESDSAFRIHALNVEQWLGCELSLQEEKDLVQGCGDRFRFLDTTSFYSTRITRQSGCFSYQNFLGCLRDYLKSSENLIRFYDVSVDRSTMVRELQLMGINGGNLFNDLDSIAQDVLQAEGDCRRISRH
jgi:hypothetical protein